MWNAILGCHFPESLVVGIGAGGVCANLLAASLGVWKMKSSFLGDQWWGVSQRRKIKIYGKGSWLERALHPRILSSVLFSLSLSSLSFPGAPATYSGPAFVPLTGCCCGKGSFSHQRLSDISLGAPSSQTNALNSSFRKVCLWGVTRAWKGLVVTQEYATIQKHWAW